MSSKNLWVIESCIIDDGEWVRERDRVYNTRSAARLDIKWLNTSNTYKYRIVKYERKEIVN